VNSPKRDGGHEKYARPMSLKKSSTFKITEKKGIGDENAPEGGSERKGLVARSLFGVSEKKKGKTIIGDELRNPLEKKGCAIQRQKRSWCAP